MYEIETIIPLALVIGVLMGAGITWALLKNSASQVTERVSHEYESDLAVLEEKLFSRENELSRLNADHARLEAELDEQFRQSTDLKVQASRLQTLLDEAREQADEKMRILRDAKEQMRLDFQNLANEILEDKTHRFAEQNQANIDNLLSPLQKEIGDFRHKVEEAYISDTKDRAVLFNEISRLKELNQQISQDAVNLTKALTRDSKAQGNWGELVLEKILEESGLSRGREFDIVSSGYYDQQEPYQPDVIVHLPDGRDVVIDSKINLSAYQNFRSMEEDGKRQDFLQEHLQVFRRHIRGLREKNFEKMEGVRSLDYVIMFVPVESALLTVIDEDPQLLYDANAQGIMVVSPSNLLLTLRIVKNLWRYEDQNRNAQEIAQRATGIYDKLVGFVDSLEGIGKHLDKARSEYEIAHGRLTSGRGSVIRQIESLRLLGVQPRKNFSDEVLESEDDPDEVLEIPNDSKNKKIT